MAEKRSASTGNRVRAYLQLMRFPAVFTAMADIFLGFLLTHESLSPVGDFLALLAASSGIYLAGMVFNDLFDRHIDAHERPNRPIPSGRISPRAAAWLATGLISLGPICAAFVGWQAVGVALVLVGLVLAYDRWLKHTLHGPIAMGGCRDLNILLGASAVTGAIWETRPVATALAMGIYVAGVTWFARQESARSNRLQLIAAAQLSHIAVLGLAWIALAIPTVTPAHNWPALGGLVLVTIWIDLRLFRAVREPSAGNVQATVKRMLLAIVLFDATIVFNFCEDPMLALAVVALIAPAATLGRWIFIT